MTLVDRYVHAVKSYLPVKLRDDVGDELQSLLDEKLEDMRSESGNNLSEDQIAEFLKRQGHPMTVAARYQETSALVSETLYPLYREFIKWTIFILVAIKVFHFSLALLNGWQGQSLVNFTFNTLETILLTLAYITLLFHFCGKYLEKFDLLNKWNPRSLPKITTDWQNQPRSESIFDLFGNLILLGFINGLAPFYSEHISITASPEFAALLPWANGILLLSIASNVEKIFRPLHTLGSTFIAFALSLATLILLGYVLILDSTVELQLGDKVFYPLRDYVVLIALIIIATIETWPNMKRLHRLTGK